MSGSPFPFPFAENETLNETICNLDLFGYSNRETLTLSLDPNGWGEGTTELNPAEARELAALLLKWANSKEQPSQIRKITVKEN